MSALISVAKAIGSPGSIGFLILCGAIGVFMLSLGPRWRRIGWGWMIFVLIVYAVAALPIVSLGLAARLPPFSPVWQPDQSGKGDIVVVLSGDNPWGRARETRRVLDATTPRCVLVSGSPWFVRMVMAAGVPRDRLTVDNTTSTTREQIGKLGAWAEKCGAERVVLIASSLSMARVGALAATTGVPVVLAPSPLDEPPVSAGFRLGIPSYRALRLTRDALYEHMALAYYRRSRWIR